MITITREKAEKYAKYRLPYSDEAARFVIEKSGVKKGTVLDIGAGTGLLTRYFVDRVGKLFAIEPELEMRTIAENETEVILGKPVFN